MAGRQVLIQHAIGALGVQPSALWGLQSLVSRLHISTTARASWPDVVVPSMGESIKEGTIAAVLKQAGQAVKEDEVIAQIETDKVTIDIKAPSAGTLEQLLIKPTDTVVAGQVVAVVGAGAAPAAATTARAAATAPPASPVAASTSDHGRVPMIRFPPRVTLAGARISDLPASQYDAAMAEATAATAGSTAAAAPAAAPAAASALAPEPSKAAAPLPPPAAKVAAPPTSKNKLPFVTRPDGRGGPPRRPLTARELELINLGGAW